MIRSDGWIKIGGVLMALLGLVLIVVVGDLFQFSPGADLGLSLGERGGEMAVNAGFGLLLIGIFALFLYSGSALPEEYTRAFLRTQGDSVGRLVQSLNLEGNGIYLPPRGRLTSDRVFVPLDRRPMEVPDLSDDMVLHTGSMGPSLGISLDPPGAGLVDEVESGCGVPFGSEPISGATEALERLSKGTGLFREITVRDRKDHLEVHIRHSVLGAVCEDIWRDHPDLHRKLGCPACSSVLCATTRIAKVPLRVMDVKREGGKVKYKMGKGG